MRFTGALFASGLLAVFLACTGNDPNIEVREDGGAGGDTGASSSTSSGATSSSGTSGTSSSGGAGPGCSLPHDCSRAPAAGMCADLVLPTGYETALVLDVDACTLSKTTGPGTTLGNFTDRTGRHAVNGSGSFCGDTLLNNGPSIETQENTAGWVVTNNTDDFAFGTEPVAIFAVALYRIPSTPRPNQILFARQNADAPFIGPALITSYAHAKTPWDDGAMPALEPASALIGAQARFGTAGADPKHALVALSSGARDCGAHVFRLMRVGGLLTLHVDGKKESEIAIDPALSLGAASDARIGNSPGGGQYFEGPVGQILVFKGSAVEGALGDVIDDVLMARWKIK